MKTIEAYQTSDGLLFDSERMAEQQSKEHSYRRTRNQPKGIQDQRKHNPNNEGRRMILTILALLFKGYALIWVVCWVYICFAYARLTPEQRKRRRP